jgi:beta-glucosidase
MSDWTSTYSTLGCVRSGLDLEMPQGFCMNYENIKPLIDNGVVREADIDDKVQTILENLIAYGFLDRPQLDTTIKEDNPYSREVAYKLSCESAVLLKNEGALPLAKGGNVVLMGPRADVIPCGGGSGAVDPLYSISLYEGMKQLGEDFPVTLVDDNYKSQSQALKDASAIVVSVGFDKHTEKEDHDRTFALPEGQDDMIEYACSLNDNVIVVVYSGGAIDMSRWHDKVSAVIMGWYPGQEGGLAIARMIAGEISPCGRLPISIEAKAEDNPCAATYYVGKPMTKRGFSTRYVTYSEGVFVGYRGYDRSQVKPLYPFGNGLTYTTFEYSNLRVTPVKGGCDVQITLTNTGAYDASEVVQVYVGEENPSVPRPVKELKAFKKAHLAAGESQVLNFRLDNEAFAFYDVESHDWKVNSGQFNVYVGASAGDVRLNEFVNIR